MGRRCWPHWWSASSRNDARLMTLGLGPDAGGSATRWALSDPGGTIVASGEVAPFTGHLFSEAERARLRDAVSALARALPHPPAAVVAGITGMSATAPAAVEAAA